MSEMCCTRLAENTRRKKSPFWHHRTTLSGCIFAAKVCNDNRKKVVKFAKEERIEKPSKERRLHMLHAHCFVKKSGSTFVIVTLENLYGF